MSMISLTTSQRGFSLVELMIALVIGMIVISGATGLFIGTFGANAGQMKMSRLNNELRTVITNIARDVRRAGYVPGANVQTLANSHGVPIAKDLGSGKRGDELAIAYFLDEAHGEQVYSYKHEIVSGVGAIRTKIDAGTWSNLTDPAVVNITSFRVDRVDTVLAANCGQMQVTIPEYTILIEGALVSDTGTVRSIRESVRPRNEVVVAAPCTP